MFRALPPLIGIAALLCGALPARAAERLLLERGAAITDPLALRELDLSERPQPGPHRAGFGLRAFIPGARADHAPILNDELFALPSMAPVLKALDDEFTRYIERHEATLPEETIGLGASYDWQIFDRRLLDLSDARFVLSGIVNRMDRAYVAPEGCGEVRLVYRLTRNADMAAAQGAGPSRWPMTLNLVLRAKGEADTADGSPMSCRDIAARWLATAAWSETGRELAQKLKAPSGPLARITPSDLVRIETNLQIAYVPKSAAHDFRTDYLLKVFDYDARSGTFEEAALENQIDRDRLLSNPALGADFKSWLLEPVHFRELDRGTILIPRRFLARSAIAPTPLGFAEAELQPEFGLVVGDDSSRVPLFGEDDVIVALKNASAQGDLENIRSMAGFERRLNDITCGGCHQTRGIGGFHFPGVDWMAGKPSNSAVVPASPHFFGDQIRRRDILAAFRDGKQPDFSRGFADRAQARGDDELAGTEYQDGWGAHCYVQRARAADNDRSFVSWTCAAGLTCQTMNPATRIGMCFVNSR